MPKDALPGGGKTPILSATYLADLKIGGHDKRGKKIYDILWSLEDFAIYRTRHGITCHFSDDSETAEKQRRIYTRISEDVSEFNHLMENMQPFLTRTLGLRHEHHLYFANRPNDMVLYEREYARRIAQAVIEYDNPEADLEPVRDAFQKLFQRVAARISNRARITHLVINIFFAALVASLAYMYAVPGGLGMADSKLHTVAAMTTKFQFYRNELALAMMMGCLGALFSTAARLNSLAIDPTITYFMHIVYAFQRVLVGMLGAVVLYFGVRSGILNGLLQPFEGELPTAKGIDAYWLGFICIIAGFSERFVPNLLAAQTDRSEMQTQ